MTKDNEEARRCAENFLNIALNNGGIHSVFVSKKSLINLCLHTLELINKLETNGAPIEKAVGQNGCKV